MALPGSLLGRRPVIAEEKRAGSAAVVGFTQGSAGRWVGVGSDACRLPPFPVALALAFGSGCPWLTCPG